MKLYVVFYHGAYDKTWQADSVNPTREMAEAKMAYERLAHPTWPHFISEVEAPDEA
jgi:hypothetical protein